MDSQAIKSAATIDFETLPIERRPKYPPEPVGVAIEVPGSKPRYLAWGHPTGNNCSWEEGRRTLGEVIDSGRPLLFHNAKFDCAVMEERLDLELPYGRIHDTLPMIFLDDPRAPSLSLKPSAERILHLAPDERDAVVDWLVDNLRPFGKQLSRSPKSPNYAGAYIAFAPADIVGKYAIGDTTRTRKLAAHLQKSLKQRGMWPAYEREMRLLEPIMKMEREGVRVDTKRLDHDISMHTDQLKKLDAWLKKKMRASDINLDSDREVINGLSNVGLVDIAELGVTPTGQPQANKDALERAVTDSQVLSALVYRSQLCTCLRTFMMPWYETACQSGGLIYTSWHTTRTDGASSFGTRTGRLSSTPNFQNIPNEFRPTFSHLDKRGSKLPKSPVKLAPLPYVRSYIVPHSEDDVLLVRDYSQQEPRITAHFEDGQLLADYQKDPWLDVHDHARDRLMEATHRAWDRKPVKNTNLGLIYGMGIAKLAMRSGIPYDEAKILKNDLMREVFPGLKAMYQDMRRVREEGGTIRTWGGREYSCEESKIINGQVRHFDYKLVNVLIQGSAADATKEALIRFHENVVREFPYIRVILQVHDELVVSAPRRQYREIMEMLRYHMESIEFDVPLLSEGQISSHNWGYLDQYDSKGEIVYADAA